MQFTFTVKPRVFTIKNASSPIEAANIALDKINNCYLYSCGCYGNCHYTGVHKALNYNSQNDRFIYCYNVETFKRGKYKGKKYYIVYVYKFDLNLLSELRLSVIQKTRNFKFIHTK